MARTKNRKRRANNILKYRKENDIERCDCCGVFLADIPHHHLCNKCWRVKKHKPFEWKNYYDREHKKYLRYRSNSEISNDKK